MPDGGATECCMLACYLSDLGHIKQKVFTLLAVKETFAGFTHVGLVGRNSGRVSVTTPAVGSGRRKPRSIYPECAGRTERGTLHPLTSE